MPFSTIVISEGESRRTVEVDDFLAINLHRRMTLILEDRVQFFDGERKLVTFQALKAIYRRQK